MSCFPLYYHPLYSEGLHRSARFPVDRYRLLADRLSVLDLDGKIHSKLPRLATREEILLVHDEDFVDRFLSGALSEKEVRRIGLRPWKKEIVPRTLRLVGGALDGLEDVLGGNPIAGNMAGGTHHAFRAEGAGYCIFNDLAICAEVALARTAVSRILVLDLDVHQGDGTAEIFAGDDRVFTLSLHGKNNFPFRKKRSDLDLEFEDATEDEEYLSSLSQVLEEISGENFDLVFFQAGVDGMKSDQLGLLHLSREGLRRRNEQVFAWRKKFDLPLLIFMGGGYANPIDDTVDAFCDLFLAAAGEFV